MLNKLPAQEVPHGQLGRTGRWSYLRHCPQCDSVLMTPIEAWRIGDKTVSCHSCYTIVRAQRPGLLTVVIYLAIPLTIAVALANFYTPASEFFVPCISILLLGLGVLKIAKQISLVKAN